MTWNTGTQEERQRWWKLRLGGVDWPGIWDVQPSGFKREIEIKKEKGKDGIFLRDQGMNGAQVTCTGQILSSEWQEVEQLLGNVSPATPGSIRTPLQIEHPKLSPFKISTVYVEGYNIDGPGPGGALKLTLDCVQWFPAPKEVDRSKEKDPSVDPGINGFQEVPFISPVVQPGQSFLDDALLNENGKADEPLGDNSYVPSKYIRE